MPSGESLRVGHCAAAFRAFAASLYAVIHAADLLTALGAGFANLGADRANLLVKSRAAGHEVSRGLADFGAIHHQAEMCGLDVVAPRRKAVGHRGMQTGFVALTTSIYAWLHAVVGPSVMGHLGVVHCECSR